MNNKRNKRITRHRRIRAKVHGTASRPRLAVFRSNKHLHLQLIDDAASKTLASASTLKSKDVAKALSDKADSLGIKEIVFDRGGYQYHGRITKIAEALRGSGLKF
ncbi:MAG: 50S ribosomal protein L18 [Candidatus Doudnabacteria bacterium RIFCSPHIGHO2_01_FULL_46_14]|uniref:Large ribosomal subunit protein uL18 n=1 Tax=Candidatus Doudnabacteria bacterium RIFCSPHIGHO2_01_FULL_46_14 TaxID=1817824 RepID=A0A1F5NL58_9BACT|nr:ribosomal protein L18 [uncultured bacterium]OGE78283.1 MAG: 50S ribosomal protein L18 [Candidatus Doudnabacteria bacterium RIFCSPHIGHO2_01_FULL_46_14]